MIEDCLKEVRAKLRTNLPTAFDAEDTEYSAADVTEFGAAIVLADVASGNYRFERFPDLKVVQVPSILLIPQSVQYEPWMSTQARVLHSVDVIVIVSDTHPEQLARRLFRSMEAVRRVLTQYVEGVTATSEDPVFSVRIIDAAYDHEEIKAPVGLVKSGRLSIVLEEVEDRP